MIGTMYLHHERTIVARWIDDDVPVLERVELLPPLVWEHPQESLVAAIASVTQPCRSIRVAVPSSRTPVHRFPIDDTMAHAQRLFEIDQLQLALGVTPSCVIDVALPLHRHGWPHEALIIVPESLQTTISSLSGTIPIERVFPAVVAEAVALARVVKASSTRSLLALGRRERSWEAFTIGDGGTLTHWSDHPVDDTHDAVDQIVDVAASTAASLSMTIDTVVMFGDGLTKPLFDDIARRSSQNYGWNIERLQPFSSVRTTIGSQDRAMLLRVAHMLGPVVGLVHCTPLSIDLPCVLPAEL